MKKYVKYLQYLYLAASALVLAAAVAVLVKNAEIMTGVPGWIGVLLALAGGCEAAAGLAWRSGEGEKKRDLVLRPEMKLIAGVMILFQGIFVGAVMWVLMSVMLILCGFSLFASAGKVRKDGLRTWLWIGPVSALETALGVLCFLDPALLGFSTGIMVGIGLLCAAAAEGCVWYLGRLLKVYD